MRSKSTLWTFAAAVLIAGISFILGRISATSPSNEITEATTSAGQSDLMEQRGGGYRYINPLWECDNFNPSKLTTITHLKERLAGYIQQVVNEKKAIHVAVYFRDLNSGPWLGINEKENFSPASLLKVPIMIAALKKNEMSPSFLSEKVTFNAYRNDEVNPNIVDTGLIQLNQTYTIDELIRKMIARSDNQAKELLFEHVGNDLFIKVMRDIGVDITGRTAGDDFISVKDYSSFFRLLYNATYLNKEMSERALELLTRSGFPGGIKAGVPEGWVVAHKFGERAFQNSDIKQLHDCGIIYRPGSPYLLCVMTKGDSFQELSGVIAEVSAIVYRHLSEKNPAQ